MKHITGLMVFLGVFGVCGVISACSSSDGVSASTEIAEESAEGSSNSTVVDTTNKQVIINDTLYRDSTIASTDTIHDKVYISSGSGSAGSTYYSSGVFCWTSNCEETYAESSSSVAESSSSVTESSSSSSTGGASIDVPSAVEPTVDGDYMTDNRNGNMYKLVSLSGTLWMAEDLNYETSSGSVCYGEEDSNCSTYGRLYTYDAAQRACPSGWRLPNRAEFQAVIDADSFTWTYGGRGKDGSYEFIDGMGFHWTSATAESDDKNYDSYGSNSSYAVIVVEKNPDSDYAATPALFFQVDSKSKTFSVRCVQE